MTRMLFQKLGSEHGGIGNSNNNNTGRVDILPYGRFQ